jgi:hypothetical protein
VDTLLILKRMHEDMKVQFEETYVYGPLRQDSGTDPALAEWVEQHDHEVEHVQRLIHEANAFESVDGRWHTQLARIRDALGEHIREEEEQIFPRIEQ